MSALFFWKTPCPHIIRHATEGNVALTAEEYALWSHPLMRRMEYVRQIFFMSWVWANASHTRKGHMLGVLAIAHRIFAGLYANSQNHHGELRETAAVSPGEGMRLHALPDELAQQVLRITRICALVHDCGHGPLSHTFERGFSLSLADILPLQHDETLGAIRGLWAHAIIDVGENGDVPHELVSCLFFAVMWKEIGSKDEQWLASVVAAVLYGVPLSPAVPKELVPFVSLIRDIVASAPIDADRIGYMRLDAHMSGADCGHFDLEHLLNSSVCVRDTQGEGIRWRLGWLSESIHGVADFLHARYRMYGVYYHRKLSAIALMLERVASLAKRQQLKAIQCQGALRSLITEYEWYGDIHFLDLMRGRERGRPGFPGNLEITQLVTHIMDGVLWRCVHDKEMLHPDIGQKASQVCDLLAEEFPGRSFLVHRPLIHPVKDLAVGAHLVRKGRDGILRSLGNGRVWFEESSEIRALSEKPPLTRIYVEVDTPDSAEVVEQMQRACIRAMERVRGAS